MSERLIGTAQCFLPYCAGLQQHADSIAKVRNQNQSIQLLSIHNRKRLVVCLCLQAYEIALEVKQQEQEDLIRYTSKMSESCA
jgi:hypothetical protein